jgi:hypothetical protein
MPRDIAEMPRLACRLIVFRTGRALGRPQDHVSPKSLLLRLVRRKILREMPDRERFVGLTIVRRVGGV